VLERKLEIPCLIHVHVMAAMPKKLLTAYTEQTVIFDKDDLPADRQAELCVFVSYGFEQIAVANMAKRVTLSASTDANVYFKNEQSAVSGECNVSSCIYSGAFERSNCAVDAFEGAADQMA
jgi:hypothetical protein